jgi:hypothetical protein
VALPSLRDVRDWQASLWRAVLSEWAMAGDTRFVVAVPWARDMAELAAVVCALRARHAEMGLSDEGMEEAWFIDELDRLSRGDQAEVPGTCDGFILWGTVTKSPDVERFVACMRPLWLAMAAHDAGDVAMLMDEGYESEGTSILIVRARVDEEWPPAAELEVEYELLVDADLVQQWVETDVNSVLSVPERAARVHGKAHATRLFLVWDGEHGQALADRAAELAQTKKLSRPTRAFLDALVARRDLPVRSGPKGHLVLWGWTCDAPEKPADVRRLWRELAPLIAPTTHKWGAPIVWYQMPQQPAFAFFYAGEDEFETCRIPVNAGTYWCPEMVR